MNKKKDHFLCDEVGIEKSVPWNRRLTPRGLPHGDQRDGFICPTVKLMINSYIINRDSTKIITMDHMLKGTMINSSSTNRMTPTIFFSHLSVLISSSSLILLHTGKCIRRFNGIYAYCRYFIDRKW